MSSLFFACHLRKLELGQCSCHIWSYLYVWFHFGICFLSRIFIIADATKSGNVKSRFIFPFRYRTRFNSDFWLFWICADHGFHPAGGSHASCVCVRGKVISTAMWWPTSVCICDLNDYPRQSGYVQDPRCHRLARPRCSRSKLQDGPFFTGEEAQLVVQQYKQHALESPPSFRVHHHVRMFTTANALRCMLRYLAQTVRYLVYCSYSLQLCHTFSKEH